MIVNIHTRAFIMKWKKIVTESDIDWTAELAS